MPPKATNPCCDLCGQPFGPNRQRHRQNRRQCDACGRQHVREQKRRMYEAKQAGTFVGYQHHGAPLDRSQMEVAVREHYQRADRDRLGAAKQTGHARTCDFCGQFEYVAGWLACECSLGLRPDDGGGCEKWEPRYRVGLPDE